MLRDASGDPATKTLDRTTPPPTPDVAEDRSEPPPLACTGEPGSRARRRHRLTGSPGTAVLSSLTRQTQHLALHQFAIDAVAVHQLLRRAVLNDFARYQHDDSLEFALLGRASCT